MNAANVSYSDLSSDPSAIDLKSRSLPFFAVFKSGTDGPEVHLFKLMDKAEWANVSDTEITLNVDKNLLKSPSLVMSQKDFLDSFSPVSGQDSGIKGAYVRETETVKSVVMAMDFYVEYDGEIEKGKPGQVLLQDPSGMNRIIDNDGIDYKPANEKTPAIILNFNRKVENNNDSSMGMG